MNNMRLFFVGHVVNKIFNLEKLEWISDWKTILRGGNLRRWIFAELVRLVCLIDSGSVMVCY